MLNNNPINVVCAADNNYSMPLTVTLRSVLENLAQERNVHFFIIDGGIQEHNKKKILNSLGDRPYTIDWVKPCIKSLASTKVTGHISIATYFRVLIPKVLPLEIKKAIYLDCDTLVLKDIGQLWDIEMGDAYLLACQEENIPYVSSRSGLRNYEELGIPANSKYFNAGVLVINLEKWRAEDISMKVIQYIENNLNYIRWWDQDGLNAILAGKWKQVDLRWNKKPNKQSSYLSLENENLLSDLSKELLNEPFIIHFLSAEKPWRSHVYYPSDYLFFKYLYMTMWSSWRYTFWRGVKNSLAKQVKFINLDTLLRKKMSYEIKCIAIALLNNLQILPKGEKMKIKR